MNEFEKVIKAYLDEFAGKDAEFSNKYAEKTTKLGGDDAVIKQCCNYICREVKRSGRQGFADAEIYGMAVHFIDESELTAEKGVNGQVVVNHSIELSEEDKERLRKEAEAEFKRDHKKALNREALAEKSKVEKTPAPKKEKPVKPKKVLQHDLQHNEGDLLFTWDD